jgi:hypothetical protein
MVLAAKSIMTQANKQKRGSFPPSLINGHFQRHPELELQDRETQDSFFLTEKYVMVESFF